MDQYYVNASTVDAATDISLDHDTAIYNITITMYDAGRISGSVMNSYGAPVEDLWVTAQIPGETWYRQAYTDEYGNYSIGRLPAGSYIVKFNTHRFPSYLSAYYGQVRYAIDAKLIDVEEGSEITEIDATLGIASQITGAISGPNGHELRNSGFMPDHKFMFRVYAWHESSQTWTLEDTTQFGMSGTYSIGSLYAGTYRLKLSDSSRDYAEQYYGGENILSATDIDVPPQGTASNINFTLSYAPPHIESIGTSFWSDDQFQLTIRGSGLHEYILQQSTSLTNDWFDVDTFHMAFGDTGFVDVEISDEYPIIFWRIIFHP